MKNNHAASHHKQYGHLILMAILSFIAMYILMYAMVNRVENIYPNFNQFYMAGLMAAPMVIIELVVMRSMYKNKKLNAIVLVVSILAAVAFFFGIRQQAAISDEQFLKSMIPHHSGAILMCEKASLQDPEILQLCRNIASSQQSEIDQMERILARLKH